MNFPRNHNFATVAKIHKNLTSVLFYIFKYLNFLVEPEVALSEETPKVKKKKKKKTDTTNETPEVYIKNLFTIFFFSVAANLKNHEIRLNNLENLEHQREMKNSLGWRTLKKH